MYIDVHTHILPGIDDGSRRTEESLRMLTEERQQGVTTVACTPHFYASQYSMQRFLDMRSESLKRISRLYRSGQEAAETGESARELPQLLIGAEIYYFPGCGRADLSPLCYQRLDAVSGTMTPVLTPDPLVMIEMPFSPWTDRVCQDVRDIIEKQNLTVILAHVERYYEIQKDLTVWNRVFALPVIPQINGASLVPRGFFHKKQSRWCMQFLQEHPNTLLGSDCHDMDHRRPDLQDARAQIEKVLGGQALHQMDAFAEGLFQIQKG